MMQSPASAVSLLTPIGTALVGTAITDREVSQSKQSSTRFIYYASSTSLTPAFYQSLLDHGWRRSGTLLYKPDQRASCCPHYSFRLDSGLFQPSRDQRQTVNRFNKYILGERYIKAAARLHPRSREEARRRDTQFDLVERIHEGEKEHVERPPNPAHTFVVTLESNNFSEEKYALYENYQRLVHKEPPSKTSRFGFQNFLCSSPLSGSTSIINGKERQLGSFHQCYRVDGVLVAIGVIDLLPHCVSAVYFMYHESVNQHTFGKLGALREIAMAKEDGYGWWYSGFYIHNCKKMKYKGDFVPQYMLDPESYEWNLFDEEVRRLLDENKYLSLSRLGNNSGASPPNLSISPGSTAPRGGDDPSDDDEEAQVPDPELPLWERSMPGILSREEILTKVDLSSVNLRVGQRDVQTCDLIGWEDWDMDDPDSIKGAIAELIAAVGVELAREMVVTFGS